MRYVIVTEPATQLHYQPCLLIDSPLSAHALIARLAGITPVYYKGLLDATSTLERYATIDGVQAVSIVERITPEHYSSESTPPHGQPAVP
jgi:hypothetical protein